MSDEPKLHQKHLEAVMTKTIRVKMPIDEALRLTIFEYQKEWRDRPEGLLVGPNEWVALKDWVCKSPSLLYARWDHKNEIVEFMGIPVYRTRRHGIDVVPSDGVAMQMTLGEVESVRFKAEEP